MNDVIRCLLTRRSVKKYRAEQVEEEKLEQILQAGSYAACGMGKQAGKIVVLQDPADIAQLEKLNAQILGNPDLHPFYGAPTICVVFADTSVGTWVEDGSLVIGNMLAAAHSLGVGSCWIHRARQEFESAEGKALMKKYQSLEAIREATEEDLAQTDSMSPQAARSVYRFFREKERENQPSD